MTTKRPRTLAELKADPRVKEVWQEHDGCFSMTRPSYWVELMPGYNFEGCMCIHEATVKDCIFALTEIVEEGDPC